MWKIEKVVSSWCLWCLFRPEIGAIYAERLKEVETGDTVEIVNVDAVSMHIAENMVG